MTIESNKNNISDLCERIESYDPELTQSKEPKKSFWNFFRRKSEDPETALLRKDVKNLQECFEKERSEIQSLRKKVKLLKTSSNPKKKKQAEDCLARLGKIRQDWSELETKYSSAQENAKKILLKTQYKKLQNQYEKTNSIIRSLYSKVEETQFNEVQEIESRIRMIKVRHSFLTFLSKFHLADKPKDTTTKIALELKKLRIMYTSLPKETPFLTDLQNKILQVATEAVKLDLSLVKDECPDKTKQVITEVMHENFDRSDAEPAQDAKRDIVRLLEGLNKIYERISLQNKGLKNQFDPITLELIVWMLSSINAESFADTKENIKTVRRQLFELKKKNKAELVLTELTKVFTSYFKYSMGNYEFGRELSRASKMLRIGIEQRNDMECSQEKPRNAMPPSLKGSAHTLRAQIVNFADVNGMVAVPSGEDSSIEVPDAFSRDFTRVPKTTVNGMTIIDENHESSIAPAALYQKLEELSNPVIAKYLSFILNQNVESDLMTTIEEFYDSYPIQEPQDKLPKWEIGINDENVTIRNVFRGKFIFVNGEGEEKLYYIAAEQQISIPRNELDIPDLDSFPLDRKELIPNAQVKYSFTKLYENGDDAIQELIHRRKRDIS